MDAEEQIESGIRADGPEDLRTLEDMIAADEAAETRQQSGDTGRDEAGRFKSSSAKDAQRAGERLTPEEIKASDFRKPEAKAKATADTAATKPAETETETKPDDSTAAADQAKADEAADAGKSAYRKEIDRRERSWESLNKQKAEFQAQRDEFELQRKTLEARERHLATKAGAAKLNGYTAEDYDAAAPKFEAQALAFEQAGDFDKADQQRELALKAREAAGQLRSRNPAGDGVTQAWQKLKSDLPEALNVQSPLNRELRALIQSRPDLLGDDAGPYRVAVLAGRKLVAQLESETAKLRGEAARVPELLKQVEALTAQNRELEQRVSIPGGGGSLNRGMGSERKNFASLTTAEQEDALNRELAGAL